MTDSNEDKAVISGFGDEWTRFDQSSSKLSQSERTILFDRYFSIFPWKSLPDKAIGFDMGCGSGRWAQLVAPKVHILHCIDPSEAINIAKKNLEKYGNCRFHNCGVDNHPFDEKFFDFGYSLGVLHHLPNTLEGIKSCARMLKPGAPFLIYLYYALDNKPFFFRLLWKCSDMARHVISRLPHPLRFTISQILAFIVYLPLARFCYILKLFNLPSQIIEAIPLQSYSHTSYYTMRTDALDRFGTRLERRFRREQIEDMLIASGFERITFSSQVPYWCALGFKKFE